MQSYTQGCGIGINILQFRSVFVPFFIRTKPIDEWHVFDKSGVEIAVPPTATKNLFNKGKDYE